MRCPACNKTVDVHAWLCPFCEHIIDPSVLSPAGADEDGDLAASEPTMMAPMPMLPASTASNEPLPDAVILGDVGIAADEFSAFEGAGVQSDGRTSTFLYYATGASTRVVHPDAVPRLLHVRDGHPRTPYEDFILSCVDGTRTVRQIQRASGLQPQEVVVTLLTLLDKGAVDIRAPDGGPGASPKSGRLSPERYESPPARSAAPTEDGISVVSAPTMDLSSASPVPAQFDEDIPSVSDFHAIEEVPEADHEDLEETGDLDATHEAGLQKPQVLAVLEESTQLGVPPSRRDEISSAGVSDVWQSELEADWNPLTRAIGDDEIIAEAVDPSAELPPVMPTDPDPPPDDSGPLLMLGAPNAPDEAEFLPPVVPTDLDADEEPDVTKEIFIPAKFRMPRPGDRPHSMAPPAAVLSPQVGALPAARPAPVLDPDLLTRRDPSRAPPVVGRAGSLQRPPVQERDRRSVVSKPPAPKPAPIAKANPVVAPAPAAQPAPPQPAEVLSPADTIRKKKAQTLFDQALQDRTEGNIISARMNMQLALTFDPGNDLFQTALAEFEDVAKSTKQNGPRPQGRSRAREFYDSATRAENEGDVDRAIDLLEKAVNESRQAVFLNRLGVVLAMKKREFVRAQSLIEEAIELAPSNPTYEKNLHKILARAATADMSPSTSAGGSKDKRSGLLGFLGRRK